MAQKIDDTELDRLLYILEQPDPPRVLKGVNGHRQQFDRFLDDTESKKGAAVGVEVAVFYRFYSGWRESFDPKPALIPPFRFARYVRSSGFRRVRRQVRGGRDQRCLGMSLDTAHRIREFIRENPITPADLAIFDPKTRWGRS